VKNSRYCARTLAPRAWLIGMVAGAMLRSASTARAGANVPLTSLADLGAPLARLSAPIAIACDCQADRSLGLTRERVGRACDRSARTILGYGPPFTTASGVSGSLLGRERYPSGYEDIVE
jgi:hypothetical protein